MGRKKETNNKDARLNKVLKISFIICLISGIIALVIVLNKGKIFGKNIVNVSSPEIKETHVIQLTCDKTQLAKDDTAELIITIDGVEITEGYEIVVSNPEVVSVEGHTVTALEEGTTTIKATNSEYGIESEISLEVVVPITKLTLSSEFKTISVGGESIISHTIKPTNATVNIAYESSDESIATVNESGVVTGVSKGTVTITGTDKITGKTATHKITVR